MKDLQRDLEDSRAAQKETLTSARESERRSKAMEADVIQLHEVRPGGQSEQLNFTKWFCELLFSLTYQFYLLLFVQMLAAAERARKQVETERDELSEELSSNSSGKWVLSIHTAQKELILINKQKCLRCHSLRLMSPFPSYLSSGPCCRTKSAV